MRWPLLSVDSCVGCPRVVDGAADRILLMVIAGEAIFVCEWFNAKAGYAWQMAVVPEMGSLFGRRGEAELGGATGQEGQSE